ncbi:MAG: glucan biosynthesis protein [Candidatus Omnitrophica bacterium]|nr:glucan biosynthesis protein [Candidatus Omnitrophota bacterium]
MTGRALRVCSGLCAALVLWAGQVMASGGNTGAGFHFQDVVEQARVLAQKPFEAPGKNLPEALKKIGYDQWRDIRFKPSAALWAHDKSQFTAQFFHLGFLYQQPVMVHVVDQGKVEDVRFTPEMFDYAKPDIKPAPDTLSGFAGFRLHYPINTSKYADELVSFLGASYFRGLGKNLFYGMSARGLAVNTAMDTGEEFPLFKEFWLVRPLPGASEITFYALLDSDSVTGAYAFIVRPGDETEMKIKSVLFVRRKIEKLGVAPLTSMFFYGENGGFKGDTEFRPEVHDSDGFLIQAKSKEWTWHPLVNPAKLLINSFGGDQPLGFGLLQRDTDFDHYQDLEARYDFRPSVWVVPQGDWGKGRLELIQLPTTTEYNDNIGAYWVPEKAPEPGQMLQYAYSLFWHSAASRRPLQGYVDATRIVRKLDAVTFYVDFTGGDLRMIASDRELAVDLQVYNHYRVLGSQLIRNTATGGWRFVLTVSLDKAGMFQDILPDQRPPLEMRVFLKKGVTPVTETWSYTYLP